MTLIIAMVLNLSDRNILITGSQTLYFCCCTLAATPQAAASKSFCPLAQITRVTAIVTLMPEALIAYKPTLDIDSAARRFKYRPVASNYPPKHWLRLFSRP